MEMPTGYDLLEHSHEFRMHMLKRLAAGLIDAAAVFIPVTVVIFLAGLEPREVLTGTLTGFGWFFYSVISEARTGSSLGKRMMGLTVASKDGPMTLSKAVIRNVPKMFWFIFLPVDVLVGLSRDQDPRQRWVDSVSSTTVIKVDRK
jgi:uncharacterized RDD family membrane protein YckC